MKRIKIHFEGQDYELQYKVETVDLNVADLPFINVYSVFIEDENLRKIAGAHFTLVQNMQLNIQPAYERKNPADIEENNLKKLIGQQIMNDNKK